MDWVRFLYVLVILVLAIALTILVVDGLQEPEREIGVVFAEADVNCPSGSKWTVSVENANQAEVVLDPETNNIDSYTLLNDETGDSATVDCTANGGKGSCGEVTGKGKCKERE